MAYSLLPLLLLPILFLTIVSADCDFFPWKNQDDFLIVYSSQQEKDLRTWQTELLAQYSPATSQLVVLFRTPPSRERLGQVKLLFDATCNLNKAYYHLLSLNDTESISENVTLATVDQLDLPQLSEFCLFLEVYTYQNGDSVKQRAFSPMARGCHVNLHATDAAHFSNRSALPLPVAELLKHRYGLFVTDNCCLQYARSSNHQMQPSQASPLTSKTLTSMRVSPQLLTGLYVLVAVLSLLSLMLLIWLARYLVALLKKFKAACKAQYRELALRQRLRAAQMPVCRAQELLPADLAGPPYHHLLTHCKSVRTRQRIATMVPPKHERLPNV
ncbi:hypothetical protein BOX15_Mlig027826g1 [Macrostomum lignano]|uniref:Uncharacterized protein n=1 Tax=Macrostomum lignano TaxID=282301 RepID=A0A267DRS8_9PLAT|nr:hypothetical protein BOX15_Mlig027826g1 [Macrostomum lignano]